MSCLTEMMPLPIVSPSGNRVVDHRLLLGVASSSDRSWLHLYEGCNSPVFSTPRFTHIKPNAISNVDEKGFLFGQTTRAKVIGRRGKKNPHIKQYGGREMVTLIEAVTASGFVYPPLSQKRRFTQPTPFETSIKRSTLTS